MAEFTNLTLKVGGDSSAAVEAVTRLSKALDSVSGALLITGNQAQQSGAKAEQAMAEVAGAVGKAVTALEKTADAFQEVNKEAAEAKKKAEDAAKTIEGRFKAAAEQIEKYDKGFTGLRTAMTSMAAPMNNAVKLAMDFDAEMRKVNSVAKLSTGDFNKLSDSVLKLASQPGVKEGPAALAQGLHQLYDAGLTGQQALDALYEAATGATAGFTTTATATGALLKVLDSGVGGVRSAGEVMDVLVKTVDAGRLTFEQLGGALGTVLPTATRAGVSLQEVGAALTVMTQSGQPAEEAAKDLAAIIEGLAKPGKDAADAYYDLCISYGETGLKANGLAGMLAEVASKTHGNTEAQGKLLPGLEKSRGLMALLADGGSRCRDTLGEMERATHGVGAKQSELDRQLQGAKTSMEDVQKQFDIAAISAGKKLLPPLTELLKIIGKHPEVASFAFQVGAIATSVNTLTQALKNLGAASAWKWFAGTSVGGKVAGAAPMLARGGGVVGAGLLGWWLGRKFDDQFLMGPEEARTEAAEKASRDLDAAHPEAARRVRQRTRAEGILRDWRKRLEAVHDTDRDAKWAEEYEQLESFVDELRKTGRVKQFEHTSKPTRRSPAPNNNTAKPSTPHPSTPSAPTLSGPAQSGAAQDVSGPKVDSAMQARLAGLQQKPWFAEVNRAMQSAGISPFAWSYNALMESGGELHKIGDGDASHGLFQFYFGGGEGNGFTRWLVKMAGMNPNQVLADPKRKREWEDKAKGILKDPEQQGTVAQYVAMRARSLGIHKIRDPHRQAWAFADKFENPAEAHKQARYRYLAPRFGAPDPMGAGARGGRPLSPAELAAQLKEQSRKLEALAQPDDPRQRLAKQLEQLDLEMEATLQQKRDQYQALRNPSQQQKRDLDKDLGNIRKGYETKRSAIRSDYEQKREEAQKGVLAQELEQIEMKSREERRRLERDPRYRPDEVEAGVQRFRVRELEDLSHRIGAGKVAGIDTLSPAEKERLVETLAQAQRDRKAGQEDLDQQSYAMNVARRQMDLGAAQTPEEKMAVLGQLQKLAESESQRAGARGDAARELQLREDAKNHERAIVAIRDEQIAQATELLIREEERLQTVRETEATIASEKLEIDRREAEAAAEAAGPEALQAYLRKRVASLTTKLEIFAAPTDTEQPETLEERQQRERKVNQIREERLQITERLRSVDQQIASQAAEEAQIRFEAAMEGARTEAERQKILQARIAALSEEFEIANALGKTEGELLKRMREIAQLKKQINTPEMRLQRGEAEVKREIEQLGMSEQERKRAEIRDRVAKGLGFKGRLDPELFLPEHRALRQRFEALAGEWIAAVERQRNNWRRFWKELGQTTGKDFASALSSSVEAGFTALMGGEKKGLAQRLLESLRSAVARALTNVTMRGAESLFRGAGELFTGGRRKPEGPTGRKDTAPARDRELRGNFDSENAQPLSPVVLPPLQTAATPEQKVGETKENGKGSAGVKQLAGTVANIAGALTSLTTVFSQAKPKLHSVILSMIGALMQLVAAFSKNAKLQALGPIGQAVGLIGGISGMFADGGEPPVGRPALVGERGPELFVPKVAGTVIPNHVLRVGFGMPSPRLGLATAGSGSPTHQRTHNDHRAVSVTNHFYGNVGDLGEVRRHERDEYEEAWKALATG